METPYGKIVPLTIKEHALLVACIDTMLDVFIVEDASNHEHAVMLRNIRKKLLGE